MTKTTADILAAASSAALRTPELAAELDAADDLASLRGEFILPTNASIGASLAAQSRPNESCTYLCGNSLGAMPKRAETLVREELGVWATQAVEGHFKHALKRDWLTAADLTHPTLAQLLGAEESEVVCMGTLTANLHLMMNTFYKPTAGRNKILCEARAFPSDQASPTLPSCINYAFASQAIAHGLDPKEVVIELSPRSGEFYLRNEDVLDAIEQHGQALALVLFPGIQYYTGQAFDMPAITKAAHSQGAICAWDLAHGIGNLELHLHDWEVDFAVWCSYKYLNAGPGAIAGLYVHRNWDEKERPRHAGWWGHELATRFQMPPHFKPIPGAQGFQQSNPSVLTIAALLGSLEVFKAAGGMGPLRRKAVTLTLYLERALQASTRFVRPEEAASYPDTGNPAFTIITPADPQFRGSQLSLLILPVSRHELMEQVFAAMLARGVLGDERRPNVIRLAPTALYNTFEECRYAAVALDEAFDTIEH
ncbi:kynureninase [Exidia glandulosa HHB12029]|uniref:Kynureninase n=1 Tax=Exidia glandulosa HHB12029 TaxID=1314781 RepID=A0A165B188_EXIGL|nr:kynureninase [Exidia glandulosa HHB12029]